MDVKFCPKCGTENLQQSGNKLFCENCDFVLYQNTAAAVAVLLKHGNEILFTVRNQEPGKGLLDLPGGFCDPEETGEHTCKREIYEELQLDLDEDKFSYLGSRPNIYPYKDVVYNTLDLFYEYELSEKPRTTLEEKEISGIEWVEKDNIDLNRLAFESQKLFLAKYFGI